MFTLHSTDCLISNIHSEASSLPKMPVDDGTKLYHTFQTLTELITHLIHNNAHLQIHRLYVISLRNSHSNKKHKAKLRHHEYVPVKNCTG